MRNSKKPGILVASAHGEGNMAGATSLGQPFWHDFALARLWTAKLAFVDLLIIQAVHKKVKTYFETCRGRRHSAVPLKRR
jgi:hypothetical protein